MVGHQRSPIALSGSAFGVRFEVRVNDPAILPAIESLLPPGAVAGGHTVGVDRAYALVLSSTDGGSAPHALYVERRLRRRSSSIGRLLRHLRRDLELNVARLCSEYVFVHAGAVVWGDRALLLPGRSFSGKSTLVAALVQAGAGYLSDEYALLDADGLVHAYPSPLALRRPGGRRRHPLRDLYRGSGRAPAPVGAVVITRFRPRRRWRPRAVDAGEAVVGLLANTVAARDRPATALRVLKRAVAGATLLAGDRGEAAEIVEPLLRTLSSEELFST